MRDVIIKKGEMFDDFKLMDQDSNPVDTEVFKGKKILLSFHPLAWTPICKDQMKLIEADYDKFQNLGIVPLGISVDSSQSKRAWADAIGIKNLRLLADFWPHGELANKLGIFMHDKGFSKRVNIVLDEDRKVIWIKEYPIQQVPDFQEILTEFK